MGHMAPGLGIGAGLGWRRMSRPAPSSPPPPPAASVEARPGQAPIGIPAACYEFGPRDRGLPERVMLFPAGRDLVGRDGKRWVFDAEKARDATAANQSLIPLDFNHATELRAALGEETPAAGWITRVDVQAGALWGSVEWTDKGRYAVMGRSYRYLSPAFQYDEKTREVGRVVSVALVNKPNLRLPALNREGGLMDEETTAGATGQAAAGEAAAPAAAPAAAAGGDPAPAPARAAEAAAPALSQFVPRADYDQAVARAAEAERRLSERARADREAEIESAVRSALEAGKIAPGSADYHRKACAAEGGLENFRAFVSGAPELAGPSGLDGRPPDAGAPALSAEGAQVAAMFGNSPEDLRKFGGPTAAREV